MENHQQSSESHSHSLAVLTLSALGVVYGDIGTSPLYAFKQVFETGHVQVTHNNILGILSVIFWTLIIVVSIKYVLLMLRADNKGEGGTIALLTLVNQVTKHKPFLNSNLILIGIFSTAIFYGDGIITPAVTVMGAVEGLETISPKLTQYVIPVSILIITLLFIVQRFGTASIGKIFGPITLIWFLVLIGLGLPYIIKEPRVLWAINPVYGIEFFLTNTTMAFVSMGAVFLVVTGGEALYADLGHFGKTPIRHAWFGIVMPALVINYFGQGALLLEDPEAITNPFFLLAPDWGRVPLLLLATAAAAIASQAMITAVFSVTKQAIQMGFLPRMQIKHTSRSNVGQIYIPFMNWMLYLLIILAVVSFGSSTKLTHAYGIAVSLNMVLTTYLAYYVARYIWGYYPIFCLLATAFFLVIDVTFLASNFLKFFEGGWFPIFIGVGIFTLMTTWKQGREILSKRIKEEAIELATFLKSIFLHPPARVPGTAVFMIREADTTPNALMHNLKHNKVLHNQNIFLHVRHHETPWIKEQDRLEVKSLGHDCWQVTLNFGFKNDPHVPQALQALSEHGVHPDPMETTYFLSRDIVMPTLGNGGMAAWREKLFATMHYIAAGAADFLSLPTNRVVELGSKVEI